MEYRQWDVHTIALCLLWCVPPTHVIGTGFDWNIRQLGGIILREEYMKLADPKVRHTCSVPGGACIP